MKCFSSLFVMCIGFLMSCDSASSNYLSDPSKYQNVTMSTSDSTKNTVINKPEYKVFDRTGIRQSLQQKIDNQTPLVVHVMVPLCDNDHQGIVPTTASLGNGLSLKSNLYWATSNGMKRYFKESKDWNMMVSLVSPVDSTLMERVVFERVFDNGARVILVTDAYRGDRMEACLTDYFNSLAGSLKDTVVIANDTVLINGHADLLAFNGHNGLMDVDMGEFYNVDGVQKDAVVIACSSMYDFNYRLNMLKAYPLVMTTNLLYPGAFVLEGIVNKWAMMNSDETIRLAAGNAYHRVKKCGIKGARNLFSTGW